MNMKQRKKNLLRDRLQQGLQQSLASGSPLAKKVSGTGLAKKTSGSALAVGKKTSGTALGRKAAEPEAVPVRSRELTDISDDDLAEFDESNVSSPAADNFDDGDFVNAMEELEDPAVLHDDEDSDEQLPPTNEGSAEQSEEPVPKKKKKSSEYQMGEQKQIKISPAEPFVKGVRARTCLNRGRSLFEIKRKEALVRLRIAEEELRCTKVKTKIVIANKRAMKEIMENQIALSSKQSVL